MPRTRSRRSLRARSEVSRPRRPGPARPPAGPAEHALDRAQVHAQRDQAGLGAVVQVPLDPAQFGGGVIHGQVPGLGSRCTRPSSSRSRPGISIACGCAHQSVRGTSHAAITRNALASAPASMAVWRVLTRSRRTAGRGRMRACGSDWPARGDHEPPDGERGQRHRDQVRGDDRPARHGHDGGQDQGDCPRVHAEHGQADQRDGDQENAPAILQHPVPQVGDQARGVRPQRGGAARKQPQAQGEQQQGQRDQQDTGPCAAARVNGRAPVHPDHRTARAALHLVLDDTLSGEPGRRRNLNPPHEGSRVSVEPPGHWRVDRHGGRPAA